MRKTILFSIVIFHAGIFLSCFAQDTIPFYLKDRGRGIPTSLFGTYIERKDIVVYPFFEYYLEKKNEYNPSLLGFNMDKDFEGKFSATEELLFLGYGITDWLMVEGEASIIQAKQEKAAGDSSNMPSSFKESGIETLEGQFRWRYWKETDRKPELFSYFHTDLAMRGDHKMIGEESVVLKFGSGVIKGFRFGTLSANTSVKYIMEDEEYEFGGVSIEYLKRINDKLRLYIGFEGIPDDIELITELQIFPRPWMFIRLNNAVGISPAATDIAPEIGIVMYLNKAGK